MAAGRGPSAGGPGAAGQAGGAVATGDAAGLRLAVLLLSAAALFYEVLLVRLFSIIQWHHFAYMAISLALLGYGAAGSFLTLAGRRLLAGRPVSPSAPAEGGEAGPGRAAILVASGAALFAATSVGAFLIGQRLPFNPLAVSWEPAQLWRLMGLYLLLAVPFFGAAAGIGLALMRPGAGVHRVYAADLLGAGAGAVAVVGALSALPPERCLTLPGALALAGASAAVWRFGGVRRWGLLALAAVFPWLWPGSWLALRPSEYKGLERALLVPGTRVVTERSSPLALLTVVDSTGIPLRHAPGLSLRFTGRLPDQLGIFFDADALATVDRWDPDAGGEDYLEFLPTALPYRLLVRPSVLVLGAGGGAEVRSALLHGARRVEAIEIDRQVVELLAGPLAGFSGGLYGRPEVVPRVAEARAWLASTTQSYDLIQVAMVDSFAAAAGGSMALSTSYLYTVEAFVEALGRLEPGGLLAVTRWLRVPPRDGLKLFATAVAALERCGVEEPGRRLAMVRSWSTATLLIKNGELSAGDAAAIRDFCRRREFDLVYLPGMNAGEANRFHLLDGPSLFDGAAALLGDRREAFLRDYKFHVAPATDDRPYFFHFFKWRALPELLRLRARGGAPLLEWGYLVLVATLVQAILAAVVLILLPLAAVRGRGEAGSEQDAADSDRGGGDTARGRSDNLRAGAYFGALGLAFLFVEISFIQRLTLYLGHPLYAVAVALASFLLFAGAGSALSGRWPADRRRRAVGLVTSGIAGLALAYLWALPALFRLTAHLPPPGKALLAVAVIAPLALLMGMPFPLGLARAAAARPQWVPWAWGINGCASVISAVLAQLLAIHLGFTAVIALGAALYLLAGGPLAAQWPGREEETSRA